MSYSRFNVAPRCALDTEAISALKCVFRGLLYNQLVEICHCLVRRSTELDMVIRPKALGGHTDDILRHGHSVDKMGHHQLLENC